MTSLAQCRHEFNLIKDSISSANYEHIRIANDKTIIFGENENKIYIPSPTGTLLHNSDSFVNLVMGAYGSGKTTMCLHSIVRHACNMPIWKSGRRRSRWAIVRNTAGELYSTTLQSWLTWFGELGDITKRQKPLLTYEHIFNDGKGIVELELIFIALDREEDIRKIKSLEVTGVYINELSEVPQGALSHFKGRVNHRYPSRSFCSDYYWSGIIADTNPPDIDHWIYRDFETASLDSYRIFHQPPGLIKVDDKWRDNPDCDNYRNLEYQDKTTGLMKFDYYTKLAEGQTEEFVKVYCLGEYGLVGNGKLVYPEFNSDIHVVDDIAAIQGDPIHLFWDFGLTPACTVFQISERGQVRLLKEFQGEDMGIRTFANNIVIPQIQSLFPYCKIGFSDGDPSGSARDDVMEELSCIGELNSLGIVTNPASTNNLAPRIGGVKYLLNTMIDGKPAFIISRKGCPKSIKGFSKDYYYKRVSISGEERYKDEPCKNMSSHIQDTIQYAALRFAASHIISLKSPVEKVDMFNPVMRIF
jgi:hypothetical protein